jgi:hypothetical protein
MCIHEEEWVHKVEILMLEQDITKEDEDKEGPMF